MENGARDIPGHRWIQISPTRILGLHANSGPFGIRQWWSSDAPDGALLYLVHGEVDTWTADKADGYRRRGFVHYHELVTTRGRSPHPAKVVFMRHVALRSFTLDGGPRPWLGHAVRPGIDREIMPNTHIAYPPREKLLYVVCVDKEGRNPDFLLVVGADDDDADSYGKIIDRVDMLQIGDELHHYGYNVFQTRLLVPGIFSGRIHLLDVASDPAAWGT